MKTTNFKKIVVPVDFSDISLKALDKARFLAKLWGAKIHLLHVSQGVSAGIDYPVLDKNVINVLDFENSLNQKLVDLEKKIAKEDNIEIESNLVFGKVSPKIVEFAKNLHADLIVMGTRGSSGLKDLLMGSNAYRVVMDSVCPVIAIPDRVAGKAESLGFTKILLPIDSDFHSLEKLFPSIQLAKKLVSKIYILGLRSKYDDVYLLQKKVQFVEDKIKENGISFETEMVETDKISKTVLEKAETLKSDLIVILSEHDNEFPGLMSNFAHRLVNHSTVPIMTIIPNFGDLNMGKAGFGI